MSSCSNTKAKLRYSLRKHPTGSIPNHNFYLIFFRDPQGTLNVPRVRQARSKWHNHVKKGTYLMKDLKDIYHLTKQLNTLSKAVPPGP